MNARGVTEHKITNQIKNNSSNKLIKQNQTPIKYQHSRPHSNMLFKPTIYVLKFKYSLLDPRTKGGWQKGVTKQ